jgi:hypothetical protein
MVGIAGFRRIGVARLFSAFVFLGCVLSSASLCPQAKAQAVAVSRVSGTVTDSSGSPVAGAEVQIIQANTGIARTTTTHDDGSYTLPDLPTGPYRLHVKKDGFSEYVQSGIVLQVATNPTIDVVLQVGAVTQQVTVSADAAMVETHSSSLGQVVNQDQVVDMPLNGRNAMQLVTLTPSAVVQIAGPGTNFNGAWTFPNPYQISFGGTNVGSGTYLLDGAMNNDDMTTGPLPLPFPDALQEFKVETSALPARYGMHSAATVNAVTKSGSNDFHGDAFEFVRNYLFNAKSYFATSRDNLKRNQFGGVIGGPIRKDKLFFFGAYEDTIVRSSNPTNVAFVPTAAELSGDFTAAASPQCNSGKQITLKAPFVNNMVNPSLFVAPALNFAKVLPTSTDPCGEIQFPIKIDTTAQNIVGKVDYSINSKNSLFVRYFFSSFDFPPDDTNVLTDNATDQIVHYQTTSLGYTFLVSASMVNSFHATLNRIYNDKGFDPIGPSATDLGVQDVYSPIPNYVAISIGSLLTVRGKASAPVIFPQTDFQFTDDFDWTRGSHQLAFGANWAWFSNNVVNHVSVDPGFTFSGQITGNAMADFLLGDLATIDQANTSEVYDRKTYVGLYAQDSWQVTRRFTLNYGLRWEPYLATRSKNDHYDIVDTAAFLAGIHSKVYPTAPAGLMFPGDLGTNGSPYYSRWPHFEPRIGFSYDPRGKGREVIRASYGMFYDFESLLYAENNQFAAPWGDELTVSTPPGGFLNPWQGFVYNGQTGNPFPIQPSANFQFPTSAQYISLPSNLHATNLQQWNLSVQKQFGQDWSATVSYIGNHSTHILVSAGQNYAEWTSPTPAPGQPLGPVPTASNVAQRRFFYLQDPSQGQYYGPVAYSDDDGSASYNALVASLQKRMGNHISLTANYTFSHCIDTGEPNGILVSDTYRGNLSGEVANCSYDRRHQFTLTPILQSPKFQSRALQAIVGNWQLAPLFSYVSGDWETITTGVDTALIGISSGQRPNLVGNPHMAPVKGNLKVQFFNPAAYAVPTAGPGFTGNVISNGAGTFVIGPIGNLGRNTLNGPSNKDFDVSLSRIFNINERHRIEARIEAFNAFNWVRLTDPVTAMNNPNFGYSVAPGASLTPGSGGPQDPRIMQFALKYIF